MPWMGWLLVPMCRVMYPCPVPWHPCPVKALLCVGLAIGKYKRACDNVLK